MFWLAPLIDTTIGGCNVSCDCEMRSKPYAIGSNAISDPCMTYLPRKPVARKLLRCRKRLHRTALKQDMIVQRRTEASRARRTGA